MIGAGRRFRHPSTQFRPYLFPAYRPLIMSVICFQELPPSLAALAPGVDRPSSMYFFIPGGHLPDPARVFRIVYLVDLLFGIVDHVVELQRGCPSILYSSPEPFPALNISLYCGVR